MPKITVISLSNITINIKKNQQSVLKSLQDHAIDWMHACGGKGRCTTCKMIVEEGIENLTDKSDFEMKVTSLGALKAKERLTCQCELTQGEIKIKVPDASKLPHLQYSD